MKKYLLAIFLLAGIIAPQAIFAYVSPGTPQGFVNDYAGMLSPAVKSSLEQTLTNFEKETSNEISVVTIKSLQKDTIENFAVKLFAEWGIGKKDNDNGVLVLVAQADREMRIEVGYGLEGALTDVQSNWIIQNIMRPAFQKNDYDGGVTGAVEKIMAATRGEYVPSQKVSTGKSNTKSPLDSLSGWIEVILFVVYLVFIWLASILGRTKSWWLGGLIGAVIGLLLVSILSSWLNGLIAAVILGLLGLFFDYVVSKNYHQRKTAGKKPSWWAGGGFGGGSSHGGGFGGGFSGGGGASGSW